MSRKTTGNGADTPYNAVADPAMLRSPICFRQAPVISLPLPSKTTPRQPKRLITVASMLSYKPDLAYIASANILTWVLDTGP